MAALSAGAPIVKVYHDKSMILPDVSRVLACLYEKDIKFETHPVSSYKSLLRLQALNHAPVPFYDGPTFLEESREICRYIAETYEHHGYPFLLGKDSLERASIEQWLHHEEHAFNPPSRSLFCHLAFPLEDEENDDADLQKRKLDEVLEIYEQRLSDTEYLAGNKFTLADLVHLPNSHYITASDKFVYLYDSRKNVQRWWNAISTRDSWQKVLNDIKKVEQQSKQDELEKQQQQQWPREHPTTTRRQIRLDQHTSTKSHTILVPPPVGIISTSPMAPQAEKPLPSEISPDETPTSSLSTPTSHKSSAVQSKQATIFTTDIETPQALVRSTPRIPQESPVSMQRKINFFTPPTSPATADKPTRIDADNLSIGDVSIPSEATDADLPNKSKPSSSKEVSTNLPVFDFYKASSRIDEAGPYTEPTPQETSELLDKFSETDGPSGASVQAKISPRSANEDPDQLSASQDKESVRYIGRTPQRPTETNYGLSYNQRATNTSRGKLLSTEAHQKLQAEQWHAATAGLTNLKGETDHIRPSPQVKSSKDVQHYSSQDSKQARTRPRAQEPVSMDGQLAQGPEMTTRTPYTDQRRDVSSVRWQQAADTQRIAEENEASSDHRGAVLPPYSRPHAQAAKIVPANRRKDASLLKRVRDDDAQDTTQEARETSSTPRQTGAEAHDISEGTGTYHSVSSRSQPIKASHDAAPPSKQVALKGPRGATTPYPGAQELIKEVKESPASRPTVPDHAQGSTDAEETVKSSSPEAEAQLLDSRLADAFPPKQFLDEDGYGAVAPFSLQTGYTDEEHNRKQGSDPSASRRMMTRDANDAFEETKMADSTSFKAEKIDYRQASLPQKQPPAKDPRTTTSPFQKRYAGDEDTTKQSRPRQMAAQGVQDNFEEAKDGDSWSFREQPSDTWQAPVPLPRHEEDDARSTTPPFRETYPDTGGITKESEDITSMPQRKAGEDAKGTFEETKFSEPASLRAQPLDYQRTNDTLGATSPLGKKYADLEGTTKHSRDTSIKPRKMEVQDAQDASEAADTRNSLRAHPLDAWRVATTPSNQVGAEDALSTSRSSPTRYSKAEETSKQPRAAASTPTHIAAQVARDAFRESKAVDSTSSIKQPSDARAVVPLPNKVDDAHRYSDTEGNNKEAKDTFEEKENLDSVPSRVQPLDFQRADAPSRKKEATEDPRRATSPFRKRRSDVEDTANQSGENNFKRRQVMGQDAQGTHLETEAGDFELPRDQSSDTWQSAATPREEEATQDGSSSAPLSEKSSPTNEDTIEQPRGNISTSRGLTTEDMNNTFQDSEHADSVSSREQPLSAWQPSVTPRQEFEDSHSTTAAFRKTYPYEDSTKQASDTAFAPRKIGAKDTKYISKETKVSDSASPSAKPMYTPRAALPLSDQAKIEEHARDKGGVSRETISAPKKMVSRDTQDTHVETKTTGLTSREQSLGHLQASSPLRDTSAEDAPDATRGAKESFVDDTKHSQDLRVTTKDAPDATRGAKESFVDDTKHSQDLRVTTKKSESTLQGPGSILPTTQSLGAQDAQRTNVPFGEPTGEQWKDASTQLQSDVQDIHKLPKSSSGHQKGLGSLLSQAKAGNDDQAIMGEKIVSDSQATLSKTQPTDQGPIKVNRMPSVYQKDPLVVQDRHEQAQTLSTGEKADGSTPKRRQAPVVPSTSEEKSTTSAPPRAKVHDDHSTEEPSKRGTVDDRKEVTPLFVQEPTSQVQRGTEVLQEAVDDGDTSRKLSTIDQWRLTSAPLQDVPPNSGDNELGMSNIDQKPTPMGQEAILNARGANEMIKISPDKKVEQPAPTGEQTSDGQHAPPSLPGAARDERPGELVQMQAPTPHARPRETPHARPRETPHAREAGDQEFINTSDGEISKASKATHDAAIIHEDVRDTSLSTNDDIADSKTATSNANEAQGSGTWADSTRTPVNAQLATDDDFIRFLHDKGSHPPESTQAQTPLEVRSDSALTPNTPSDLLQITNLGKPTSTEGIAPTTGSASNLETRLASPLQAEADHAEHKLAPSDKKTARAAQPPSSVELESLKEDASVSAADQTKTPQTIFRQQTRPPAPITREVPSSDTQHDMKKLQEVTLDNLLTDDSARPYVRPISGDKTGTLPGKGEESPTATQATNSEDLRNSASTQDIPANAFGNFKKLGPHSTEQEAILYTPGQASDLDAQTDYAMGEVSPAAKKFVPSDQDSVNSAQRPSLAEIKKEKTIVAAEQTLPTAVGQQDTRGMKEAPTSDIQHSLHEQKFAPSDQDLAHTTQLPSSTQRMNEQIKDSARSSQPLISVVPDQIKKSTTIGQQDISRAPEISKSPSSSAHHAPEKFQDVAPDAGHIDKSIPSQGEVSRLKPDFEPSEGPTHHVHSAMNEKTMRPPPSQAQSSDSKPDSTQNHNDERPTGFLPNQVAQQREETQVPPLPMGLKDSNLAQGVPADALGEIKSLEPPPIDQEATAPRVASELTPDTHLSIVPEEVHPTRQNLLLKDQDSAQSAQKYTPSEPTKEKSTVVAPDQVKASQTMFSQPDIGLPPALANMKDPSLDSQLASQKLQEITPDVHRIDGPIPSQEQVPHDEHVFKPRKGSSPDPHGAVIEEPNTHIVGPKSAPHTRHDMVPSELSSDEKKFEVSDQYSDRDSQTLASSESMEEEMDVAAEAKQSKLSQSIIGQQDIRHVPEISEPLLDDDRSKESVSGKEQVSHDQRASEPREASTLKPQHATPIRTETDHAEHKFTPSDKRTARAVQPLSSVELESKKEDNSVSAADQTKSPQAIFHQQARPLAPITKEDPSSDAQHGTRKIEGVTLDNRPTNDSAKSLVPSHEQVSHAPQTLPGQKDKTHVPGTRDSPATNTQLEGLTMPLVSSKNQGSFAGSSTEPHEGVYPDDGAVVDKDATKSLSGQTPQTIPGKKDKTLVPGTRDSPAPYTQLDGLTMPLVSSEEQGSYVGSSTEPHEGPYTDDGAVVDRDTKSPSSQAPVSEARPDLTSTDEPGNLPGQGAESPAAAQATYSEDLHNSASTEDISANALGSFKKHGPLSTEQEAISSTPGQASGLDAQLDSATGEVFPAAKKFAPSDQDSVNSTQRPSSAETRKEETFIAAAEQTLPTVIAQQNIQGIREAPTSDQDSAHSTQLSSSAEMMNEKIKDSARSAQPLFSALPDQTKKSTSVGQQDTSPVPGTSKSPSSEPLSLVESRKEESQPIIGQQDIRNAPVISEPVPDGDRNKKSVSRNGQFYHYQRASEPNEVSPPDVQDAKKTTAPSSQAQISDAQRDSLPGSVDVDSSSEHQSSTGSSPDQWAQLPEKTKSPLPLETSLYSESTQDVPKSSKLPSAAQEVFSPKVVPASAPDTQLGTASDKIAPVEQNISLPGQDLTRSAQPPSSAEPTKEKTTVAASDQTNDERTIIGQQASVPAKDKGKAQFSESYTQHASTKIQERTLNDDRSDEPSGGTTIDSHGVNVNDRITTSPYSQEKISDDGSDSGPTRPGIHSMSDDEPTIRTIPEQGIQPPALTQDVSVDSSGKDKSTAQEVTTPTVRLASALDTQSGSPRGEVASSEHKHTITDQEYGHSSNPPFSVEPQKQERSVAAADQQHAPQTIFDRQIITPASGGRKSSREVQKASRDDLHASELAKPPNVGQEQVPHARSASEKREGPILDVSGAVVDEKVPFPSSQAQNSDARPASTPISGDVQPASGDRPATSSLLDSQAQPPSGTQAPVESISSPQIIQNAPADSLGKKELPGPPSTDEEVMAPTTSPAPAEDAPQGTTPDQDSTHSTRLSPTESRKQMSSIAKSDQANVSQSSAGPNVARPAAETESARSLLPMTGTEPVQPPQASFNLSSDKKPIMTQGDQSNTLSDVSFSASQAVGQLESGAGKGVLSEELISSYTPKNQEGTSTKKNVKQQQQTGLSSTPSSKDDNEDTNGTVSSITTSGRIQPLPPKGNTESAEESRNQNKADQAVGQSSQDNEKQREETEARDSGTDKPEETDLHEYTNQKNNGTYQGVQPLSENTKDDSQSTKGAASGIQTGYKSESSLRTSEESKLQVQTEGKTQGGETKAPASKTELPKERYLPASSKGVASQSQAEGSDEIEEQTSSSVQKTGKTPSKLDSSTNDTKSGDTEDNPSS